MTKYYYTIITILVLGLFSCSNEETKTQNPLQARPTIPITASEVQIGTQIWMTKNLNVSRYRNGDPIPQVTAQRSGQVLLLALGAIMQTTRQTVLSIVNYTTGTR